ncbi:preprotein translocase subunit SecA [Mycoplasma zalophi]|uniref:Protein translocase subunit SecA n=1 Tax=Mycoplasma zalophi TaxID=191287 RepID=A0ABS6DQZ4_9MOLU|nr:preprotein translocase subunit SecA [Mycoplasma zalophi]MBU4692260.1 preprotein translocase subunit SecA [Mycoplasma zalophi]
MKKLDKKQNNNNVFNSKNHYDEKGKWIIPKRNGKKEKWYKINFKSAEMRIAYNTLYEINILEDYVSKLTDDELKAKTIEFKERLIKGETTEDIRVEAFAVSREATKRVLGKRPFDVQMLGGVILDLGSVAEMKTGEGKTITSIAPVYLNALTGENVIVSTVNEYLAERDATEMGEVFNWLGLSVGINKAQMSTELKRQAYNCDITYSIHSELGFDYLRDNMVLSKEEKVQRGLNYILLDEVDSILIDEAKTPLIISGGDNEESTLYTVADLFVRTLSEEDYYIDEETKSVYLTDEGISKANTYFNFSNLYNIENSELVHRIQNALRAHKIMKLDVEYIVRDDKIELVDSFTGRIMEGRAYSEGLQQAIQAKERIEIEAENKTQATITYQNFFRLFKKLSGMTGTAKTEEKEFIDIYNMRVNVIPTNKPMVRYDDEDVIYVDMHSKYMAIVEEVKKVYERKQPILIGTAQVEDSERLHEYLVKANIPHTVLNAKQNAEEAAIISAAGQLGAVTIATNMAGRGTDIKPSQEAREAGGLYVLGTDKAESRRIDNQLKGRSGRQGDVGYTKFFLSLDDQLILRFGLQDKWKEMFKEYKDQPIEGKAIQKAFLRAQKKIEGFNYDNRKSVLNYDDVIRQQRDLIYQQRDWILERDDMGEIINKMIISSAKQIVDNDYFVLKNNSFDYQKFAEYLNKNWMRYSEYKFEKSEISKYDKVDLSEFVAKIFIQEYEKLRENFIDKYGISSLVISERQIILRVFDNAWQNHINVMDKLRQSSNLVQYSQKNPYQIYTEEGSKRFNELTDRIALESVVNLMNNPEVAKSNNYSSNEETFENELRAKLEMIDSILRQHYQVLKSQNIANEEIENYIENLKQTLIRDFGLIEAKK